MIDLYQPPDATEDFVHQNTHSDHSATAIWLLKTVVLLLFNLVVYRIKLRCINTTLPPK